jgi:hypothetical protein
MSKNIFDILQSVDFEDYGSLRIPSIEKLDGNLHLYLDVVADEYPDLPRNVRIICHDLKASWISLDEYYFEFEISKDHVLLWHYTKPHISTSFYGSVEKPFAVVGELYERHKELAED